MKRLSSVLLLAACVLTFGPDLWAQNTCTSATITGRYCYRVTGFASYFGSPLTPTSSLGTATLEKTGHDSIAVSISWTQSIGGANESLSGTGVATVKPDCTGSGTFTVTEFGLPIDFELVVLNEGKLIRMFPKSSAFAQFVMDATFEQMSKK